VNDKRNIIVVTGAAGHLGANLIRTLLERGDRVRVLVHRDRGPFQGLSRDNRRCIRTTGNPPDYSYVAREGCGTCCPRLGTAHQLAAAFYP